MYLYFAIAFALLAFSVYIVKPNHLAVIDRLGTRMKESRRSGLHFRIPFFDVVTIRPALIEALDVSAPKILSPDKLGTFTYLSSIGGYIHDLVANLKHKDILVVFSDIFEQILQDFLKDEEQDPKTWLKTMSTPGSVYIRRIVEILMQDDPTWENKKPTKQEIEGQADAMENGNGEIKIPSIGFTLCRINFKQPIPDEKIKEMIDKNQEIEKSILGEEKKMKLEKKERARKDIDVETKRKHIAVFKGEGLTPSESRKTVLDLDGINTGITENYHNIAGLNTIIEKIGPFFAGVAKKFGLFDDSSASTTKRVVRNTYRQRRPRRRSK